MDWEQEPPDKLTTGEASRGKREVPARAVGEHGEARARARGSGLLPRADYARALLDDVRELEHSSCERSELLSMLLQTNGRICKLTHYRAYGGRIRLGRCPRKRRAKRAVQNIHK